MDYKNSGVDIEAGYKSVELMKKYVQNTMRPEVLTGLGGFSGAFSMESFKNMEKPTLVSGTDGVGTKIKLAFLLDKHDTIGIDCVAMCVNDIACAGGEPLFFLDYIACGKNYCTHMRFLSFEAQYIVGVFWCFGILLFCYFAGILLYFPVSHSGLLRRGGFGPGY